MPTTPPLRRGLGVRLRPQNKKVKQMEFLAPRYLGTEAVDNKSYCCLPWEGGIPFWVSASPTPREGFNDYVMSGCKWNKEMH